MIDFEKIDAGLKAYSRSFKSQGIFEYVVIDDFCDSDKLQELLSQIPGPESEGVNKSRDYMFAKNKYEKYKI